MYCDRLQEQVLARSDGPIAHTKKGDIAGLLKNGTYIFRGIRYATARRFHMPAETDAWDGVLPAVAYGYVCPEPVTPIPGDGQLDPHYYMPQDENCQYLNIWTQSLDPGAKRPVMVWMHGGGWFSGSSVEQFAYDGEELSRFGDVVVVSFNHRFHALGALDLSAYGEEYAMSGYCGLGDIVMCLRWVRDNIAAFGGDPDNVTAFGQSGGVAKIYYAMQCPEADGLFQRAAADSGGIKEQIIPGGWTKRRLAQRLAELTLQKLGILKADASETARGGEDAVIPDIRDIETVPYWDLADAVLLAEEELHAESGLRGPWRYEPVEDGAYVVQSTLRDGFRKETADIPMLIGNVFGEARSNANPNNIPADAPRGELSVREEGKPVSYILPKAKWTEGDVRRMAEEKWGEAAEEILAEFRSVYPENDPADVLFMDHEERDGQLAIASARAAMGAEVWNWLFKKESPINGGTVAWHCSELPFIFHNTAFIEAAHDPGGSVRLEEIMCTAWTNFARTGNPNGGCVPAWHRFSPDAPYTMVFDVTSGEQLRYDERLRQLLRRRT